MKNVSVKKMNGKGKNAFRAVLIVVALIFATCFALAACAKGEEVQIEKVTSASEINRLIAKANFTVEKAVRDKMEGRFGALSDYSYNDGRATADIEKDGKSYSVTVEIEVDESDFSVTRYKNATRSGDSLIYTQNGEEVTYNVANKIIVEENGYFYVIDVSGARAEIDRAVSAAILTEKGGSQEETPGDIENPGTEEPENPGGDSDSGEPTNPGDEGGNIEIENGEYQNFDEFVLDLEGENLDNFKTAVSEALRNGFTTQNFVTIFGANTTKNNTKTYKFAFNENNAGDIESVQYVGLKNNTIAKGIATFAEPIGIKNLKRTTYFGDIVEIVENGELVGIRFAENDGQKKGVSNKEIRPVENQMLVKEIDGTYSLVDYTDFVSSISKDNISTVVRDFLHTGSGQLTEENQQYFDLCMPLAVKKGYIKQDAELAFVTVEGSSSTNTQFGSIYYIEINAINLRDNSKVTFTFAFDDTKDSSKTLLERIMEAATDEKKYLVGTSGDTPILSSSDIVLELDALNNVVIYQIPQKEGENQA